MKIKKEAVIVWGILILFAGFIIWGAIAVNNAVNYQREVKKTLCEEHNFTYIIIDKYANVRNECYSMDNGILQYYNIAKLNGKQYLVRGIR